MFKRVFLFFFVNILIILTLSIVTSVLGLSPRISQMGGYENLAIFCLIWGMGGAFISLLISRWMARRLYGVKTIRNPRPGSAEERLVNLVQHLARRAGLRKMPQVGIYHSAESNAFATGATRNSSLVAVSSGLLETMNAAELEGVLAHEIAHIANGDMVTMTLLQGVINAIVMFLARIAAFFVGQLLRQNSDEEESRSGGGLEFLLVIVFQIVLGILGSMVVYAFSRYREYRADAGGAHLASREKMIAALESLRRNVSRIEEPDGSSSLATMKISAKPRKASLIRRLFSTHPPLEERIYRLQRGHY